MMFHLIFEKCHGNQIKLHILQLTFLTIDHEMETESWGGEEG